VKFEDTLCLDHPPKPLLPELLPELLLELDLEVDELDLPEPSPLEVPPIPPDFEEVFLLVMEPVDEVEVFGFTTEPATGLFWKLPLL